MAKTPEGQIIPPERIESRIFVLRGHRVMLDRVWRSSTAWR
jgi:hypothetical protein